MQSDFRTGDPGGKLQVGENVQPNEHLQRVICGAMVADASDNSGSI